MTVVIKTKKLMKNPVLSRRQMVLDVLHPDQANVPKQELREQLAKKLKVSEQQIILFGFKTAFGGGRSSGFALVYDNQQYLLKYEPKHRLRRLKILPEKQATRKSGKELKGKLRRTRGGEKNKLRKQSKKMTRQEYKKIKEDYLKGLGSKQ